MLSENSDRGDAPLRPTCRTKPRSFTEEFLLSATRMQRGRRGCEQDPASGERRTFVGKFWTPCIASSIREKVFLRSEEACSPRAETRTQGRRLRVQGKTRNAGLPTKATSVGRSDKSKPVWLSVLETSTISADLSFLCNKIKNPCFYYAPPWFYCFSLSRSSRCLM